MHDLSVINELPARFQRERLAFIGNALPRRCGIATFTTHLQQAVSKHRPDIQTCVVAMTDHQRNYAYPPSVAFQINDKNIQEYLDAANFLNANNFDVISLQHEFGIFGGEAGAHILILLDRLSMPVVTTLHTVLAKPTSAQRQVLQRIIESSAKVVVMAEKARDMLQTIYQVPAARIEVIHHGIPDFSFAEPDQAKAALGFTGRDVILTFGLLSPNKGIEVMIDAMPKILERHPNAVYVVLGATHPNLVHDQGESYRESLMRRVRERGIEDHVTLLDQFVDQATLVQFISMCDVYVTPYLNEAQMTSGTLAYSFGLGKAVVSTPYWHAKELLADGRGILVPFGDAAATGSEIAALLGDQARRQSMRQRAYAASRSMTWAHTAKRYLGSFEAAVDESEATFYRPRPALLPDLKIEHFLLMCDDTGFFQHAVHAVPDRSHGYCVDDNARALLLACALNQQGELHLPEILTSRLASFVQHAWNPQTKRFRNFMSYDRRWLEESGSEDSHGRTLWALGECARNDLCPSRRQWAATLFAAALPVVETFRSPRAWAFTLLGLDAYCATATAYQDIARFKNIFADRLMAILAAVETKDWRWFEAGLAYDNARLPQALLVTGAALGNQDFIDAGLRSLRWLVKLQTTATGLFRPFGTKGFGDQRKLPEAFDQQPVEAAATIAACLAARNADHATDWKAEAERAFAWFHGANDLSEPLVDLATGACRDGLHPDRANENRGGESVVCYLLSLLQMRQMARSAKHQHLPARAVEMILV